MQYAITLSINNIILPQDIICRQLSARGCCRPNRRPRPCSCCKLLCYTDLHCLLPAALVMDGRHGWSSIIINYDIVMCSIDQGWRQLAKWPKKWPFLFLNICLILVFFLINQEINFLPTNGRFGTPQNLWINRLFFLIGGSTGLTIIPVDPRRG